MRQIEEGNVYLQPIYIPFKRVEIRSGCSVLEIGVQLLFPNGRLPIETEHPEEVRALRVVLDEAQHSDVFLCPFRSSRWIGRQYLNYRCSKALLFKLIH